MLAVGTFLSVSSRLRLLAAAFVWSAVGVGLATAGTRWILGSAGSGTVPVLLSAGAAGWLKGRFVLGPQARANADRIAVSPETASIFSVFAPATWLLVGAMMAFGYLLRHSGLPWPVVGWIYAAVGTALFVGAVPSWLAWARHGGAENRRGAGVGGQVP